MTMKKLITGLAALTLAACGTPQVNNDTIGKYDADFYRSRSEMRAILEADTSKTEDAEVVAAFDSAKKDVFDHLNFYVAMGGVNTEAYGNIPGNVGFVRPLNPVTGAQLREALGSSRFNELYNSLLEKRVDEFKGLPVKEGSHLEGGNRVIGWEAVSTEITKEEAAKISAKYGLGRISHKRFGELTDGDKANGEMYTFHIVTSLPGKGYDLPKPEAEAKEE